MSKAPQRSPLESQLFLQKISFILFKATAQNPNNTSYSLSINTQKLYSIENMYIINALQVENVIQKIRNRVILMR